MTHYEEMYNKLLIAHEATVKQYKRLQEKNDDTMVLFKRYSDNMESYIKMLEEENADLKEKLKDIRKLIKEYENGADKKGTADSTTIGTTL